MRAAPAFAARARERVADLNRRLVDLRPPGPVGRIARVVGLTVESAGPPAAVGDGCWIESAGGVRRLAEVVGFRDGRLVLMPWEGLEGIAEGDPVRGTGTPPTVPVGPGVLGRILDPLGRPIDGLGPWKGAVARAPVASAVPPPADRPRIRDPLVTGIKAIDLLNTVGVGQRLGLFAGSGVGKSTLLGMICRQSAADKVVIALVGERGREMREFIEKDLGAAALARAVVVIATSDQPALARVKAVFTANTVADHFRRRGEHVLLLVDSLTRLAMAQREIGLAAGEPPASRGYPPSVFGLLPRVLEQAGRHGTGAITGFYTVLTEGDDWNDPVSDAARGILDGHLLLTRELAAAGHYPAIDPLESLSRLQPDLLPAPRLELAQRTRAVLAVHRRHRDLVELGAYTRGSNPELDRALELQPRLAALLRQGVAERFEFDEAWRQLGAVLNSA